MAGLGEKEGGWRVCVVAQVLAPLRLTGPSVQNSLFPGYLFEASPHCRERGARGGGGGVGGGYKTNEQIPSLSPLLQDVMFR